MDRAEKLKKILKRDGRENEDIYEMRTDWSKKKSDGDEIVNKYSITHSSVSWNDVAGLEKVKLQLKENVALPLTYPNLFPENNRWKGILLFGPPGVGKTYVIKALSNELKGSTVLSVSSCDLVSKYVGDGPGMVKDIFKVARDKNPALIILEDIDLFFENDNVALNRVKTEIIVQIQTMTNAGIFMGVTNSPWKIESAFRRAFQKRIYVPLLDLNGRIKFLEAELGDSIKHDDIVKLAEKSEGFSGSDLVCAIRDAKMETVREIQKATYFKKMISSEPEREVYTICDQNDEGATKLNFLDLKNDEIHVREMTIDDLLKSFKTIKPTVSKEELSSFDEFCSSFCSNS